MSEFNFRQVTGQSKFRAWKEWKKGDSAIGKVIGFTPNKKSNKFMDVIIDLVEHNFSDMPTLVKGDRFAMNGNTQLQKFLNTPVNIGDTIKVLYQGKEVVKTGEWAGNETHCIEGFIADGPADNVAEEAAKLVAKAASVL